MAKIFNTADDLNDLALTKFGETGLSDADIRIKVLSLTKANVAAKVARANATTNFLSKGVDLVLYLYEELLDRLDEDTKARLIEGALSNVSYDFEKDKLNIDTNPFGEVIRMTRKYPDYVHYLETAQMVNEQIQEEERQRKLEEKEAKKANRE